LAGGLTPENAAQAVKTVAPDVVDVSSGVEKDVSPCAAFAGKDAEKITKFVENVRL
jgi:phosphoribosylanthranilate isomerase